MLPNSKKRNIQFLKFIENEFYVKYKLNFIDTINNKCNGHLFIFGGVIRSFYLNSTSDDIDYKLVVSRKEFLNTIEIIKHFLKEEKISFKMMKVSDVLEVFSFIAYSKTNNKFIPIDLTIVTYKKNPRDVFSATFSLNTIHWDIKNEKLFSFENGFDDLENNNITLTDSYSDIDDLYIYFRAIYLAIKTKSKIDRTIFKNILLRRSKMGRVLIDIIKDDNHLRSKFLFKQVFGARKINPKIYDRLMKKLGIFSLLKKFLKYKKGSLKHRLTDLEINPQDYFFGELSL